MAERVQRKKTKNPRYADFVSDITTEETSSNVSEYSEVESEGEGESMHELIIKALPQVKKIETLSSDLRVDRLYHKKLKMVKDFGESTKTNVPVHRHQLQNSKTNQQITSEAIHPLVNNSSDENQDNFEINVIIHQAQNSTEMNEQINSNQILSFADNSFHQDDLIELLRYVNSLLGLIPQSIFFKFHQKHKIILIILSIYSIYFQVKF